MKIVKIEIRRLALPMLQSLVTSFGSIDHKETVITKLYTEDGLVGYGESAAINAPVYTHETAATCFDVQEQFIAPQLIGREFNDVQSFKDAYSNIVGNKAAQAGLECAFWHLVAQRDNVSLKQLFGGVKDEIAVGEGVGIKDTVDEAVAEAQRIAEAGYQRVKVKIKPGWDVEVVKRVREALPDLHLTVDANAGYTVDDVDTFKQLETFGLDMIEQPFGRDNLVDHALLQKGINTAICLDESIESVEQARTAITLGACKIINIKPGRVGGILESIAIHDLASEHNIGLWCGGMGETGIGRAFNIALASKANFTYPSDMSPYQFFYKEDVLKTSYDVNGNGYVAVPDTPGMGYEVDDAVIDKYTIQLAEVQ